jgi:threonylcarbamoyladenosine tRNA methylthiotransferase MtaB
MKQLPHATIKDRARTLRAKGQAALSARLESLIGSTQNILVEKPGLGRTPCFATVAFEDERSATGDLVSVRIVDCNERDLRGRVLSPEVSAAA